METKKSKNADLEWRKPVFFQLGIFLTLGLVLIMFELINAGEKTSLSFDLNGDVIDNDIVINTVEPPKPLPKPLPPPISNFKPVSDDNPIDNNTYDAETSPDESVQPAEIRPVAPDIETDEPDPIVDIPEVDPSFPGGEIALGQYLRDNIRYPKTAIDVGLQGRIIIGFVVDKNGNITDVSVLKGKAPILDEEALRVVKSMPKWNPGMQGGRNIKARYRIPIDFILR